MPTPLLIPLALFLPYLLLPIEYFLPFPYLIEELAKLPLVSSQRHLSLKTRLFFAVLLGICFSLSESILYLLNPLFFQNPTLFLQRLLLTTPLHSSSLLILTLTKSKHLIWLGLVTNICLHFSFNHLISPF